MNRFLRSIFIIVYATLSVFCFAQEDTGGEGSCPLESAPSPAIQSYQKNIRTVIDAVKKLADTSRCETPAGYPSRLDTVIPIHNVVDLMGRVQSTSYNFASMVSDIRYYVTNSSMILPVVQEHQKGILDLEQDISDAAEYVGTRCANSIKFKENISIEGSIYLTADRTLEQVLTDMYGQTSHVLMYFRNRVTNIADETYIGEQYFSIAPKGFALQMREYFTSDSLQKCHDVEPKNQTIKETMKNAFTSGWKYPGAIQIWKDAYRLLLYRGSQVTGSGQKDAAREAEMAGIVGAQKGGLGNSRFVINSQFFKEFGKRGNSQTVKEYVKEEAQRMAYQTSLRYLIPYGITTAFVPEARIMVAKLSLIPSFLASTTTTLPVTQTDRVAVDKDLDAEFDTLESSLYQEYAKLRENVAQNKEQDPQTVVSLVQTLDELETIRDTIEENTKVACDNLDKQGSNISQAARCPDLIGGH